MSRSVLRSLGLLSWVAMFACAYAAIESTDNVAAVAPRDIQLLAQWALMHTEAPNSSLAARTGVTPDLEPLKCHLYAIHRFGAAASLRSLGEGGW